MCLLRTGTTMKRLFAPFLFLVAMQVQGGEYYTNFSSGSATGWQIFDGAWSVTNYAYSIGANSYGGKSIATGTQFSNMICEADLVVSPGSWETGIIFRASNIGPGDNNYSGYGAAIDQSGKVLLIRGPGYNVIGETSMTILPNVSYRLQVWAVTNRIRVYIDGALKIDLDDGTYQSGSIGLMSYSAAASFDNILVSSETPNAKRDDFNDGNDNGWEKYDGTNSYYVSSKRYVSTSSGGPKVIWSQTNSADCIYQADVKLQNGWGDAGLIFRVSNPGGGLDNYSGYYFGIYPNGAIYLARAPGWTPIASSSGSFPIGKTSHLKVVTLGQRIQCYVDGVLKIDVNDNTYTAGLVGFKSYYMSAIFDNISFSQNVEGGLGKSAATNQGTFGTPADWTITTYYNPDFSDMQTECDAIRNEFRNAAFGWVYSATDGGGSSFTYTNFNGGYNRTSDMLYVSSHGNDGYFLDYNYNEIYLRGGYGTKSAVFTGKTKFVVLSACACLYYGATRYWDLARYHPVMKGAHAILGFASIMTYPNVAGVELNWVKYFVNKWHGGVMAGTNMVGLYPAWRDAIFQATYYDNNYHVGNAPAVLFTVGDLYGQNATVSHYWGWEEKTWNIYNGATYLNDLDKGAYGYEGETLIYNPQWGYPNKIGSKYSVIGTPDWSGIVILP